MSIYRDGFFRFSKALLPHTALFGIDVGPRLIQGDLPAARLYWRDIECPPIFGVLFDKLICLEELPAAEPTRYYSSFIIKSHAAMNLQPIHRAAQEGDAEALRREIDLAHRNVTFSTRRTILRSPMQNLDGLKRPCACGNPYTLKV